MAAPGTSTAQRIPPNQSLYLQNLPEKLPKDDLRRALYMLFSAHGPVLDITALKTRKMRGQAHVLFKDVQSANQALRASQGMDFFGREMRISYSQNRSNTLAKLTGTFAPPNATAPQKQGAQPPASFPLPPGAPTGQAPPGAPPGSLPGPPNALPPPPGLPAKLNGSAAALKARDSEVEEVASPQGVKRPREDEDESDEEGAPMEEEEESEMEMSEDEG